MFTPWNVSKRDLLRLNAEIEAQKGWAALRRYYQRYPAWHGNHYNPNQPRVPAGNPDGGQWTRAVSAINEAERQRSVGEGYVKVAQRGGGRYLPLGRYPEFTAQQAGRYMDAMRRLFDALTTIRKAGDNWEPYAPSITSSDSNDGIIAMAEAIAQQAEDRLTSIAREKLQRDRWRPPTEGRQPPRPAGIGNNIWREPKEPLAPSSDPRHWLQLYRVMHNYHDFLGHPTWRFDKGTVAVSFVDAIRGPVFGANSNAPSCAYTPADFNAALRMRDILISKHPDVMETLKSGSIENQSPFHAEATILLRIDKGIAAAGPHACGRVLEIHTDRDVCGYSCRKLLPKIGLELGNPTVTFIDTDTGQRRTMNDGDWEGGWK